MSNLIGYVEGVGKFFCIDNFFGPRLYGYVLMTEREENSPCPWFLLDHKNLETNSGNRRVYKRGHFNAIVREKTLYPKDLSGVDI